MSYIHRSRVATVLALLGVAGAAFAFTSSLPHASNLAAKLTATSTASFAVPELGFQLTLPAGLSASDLKYVALVNRPGTASDPTLWSTASFTTASLQQMDGGCTADEGAIGIIVRYSEDPKTIGAHIVGSVQVGPYYYGLAVPQGPCSANTQAAKMQASQIALVTQAFQSLKGAN